MVPGNERKPEIPEETHVGMDRKVAQIVNQVLDETRESGFVKAAKLLYLLSHRHPQVKL